MLSKDATDRLAFLDDTVGLLWPDERQAAARRHVLVPSLGTPRLLVPTRPRRAAVSSVLRFTAQQPPADRLRGLVLAAAVGGHLVGVAPPDAAASTPRADSRSGDTIDDHLAGVFGVPVVSSLAVSPPRPNRKPVLQVCDRRGRTLGFAKVGVNALTARLVDAEAATLRELNEAGLRTTRVPRILHHGRWHGHALLVSSALPPNAWSRSRADVLETGMREIADLDAGRGAARYVEALRKRSASAVDAADPRLAPWRSALDELAAGADLDVLAMGAWHGDWTSWNCVVQGRHVYVWDWERFAHPVPRGFDRLHYALTVAVGRGRDRFAAGAREIAQDAPALLRSWGVAAAQAQIVAALYLLDLALRYLADGVTPDAPSGRIGEWALPVASAASGRSPGRFAG